MEGVFIELCEASAEVAANEVLPSLEFGLDYDEGEVCLWVHVPGHFFHFFDLALNLFVYAVYKPVLWPTVTALMQELDKRSCV